jgi:hypothetical protein
MSAFHAGSTGELVLSLAEGNPLGDAKTFKRVWFE